VLEQDPNPKAAAEPPHSADWADMLARLGEKHARLSRLAQTISAGPHRGPSLLEEIERERARIARELHAGAGQPLAGIKINLELLDSCLRTAQGEANAVPDEARETLNRLNHLAEAALGQVRAVSHRLHPPAWQQLSVSDALRLLVEESGITHKCRTSLRLDPLLTPLPHSVKTVLYRCAQECISNVLRHSGATEFELGLSERTDRVEMTIHDNGRGIPGDAWRRGGIGLASLREHTHAAGGDLTIDTGPQGTTIRVCLPVAEE
jgi:signal transduction histidine kinase